MPNPPDFLSKVLQSSVPKTPPKKTRSAKKTSFPGEKTTNAQTKSKQNSSKTPKSQPQNRKKSQEKLDFLPTPPVASDFWGISRKSHRRKTHSISPYIHIVTAYGGVHVQATWQAESSKREKDLGEKSACESLGATQQSPQQTNRLLGPCGPKQTLGTPEKTKQEGVLVPPREKRIVPGGHFPRAQARPPASRPLRQRVPRRASRSVEPQNGKNNRPKKEQTPLPPRVQKKASEKSRENPKSARGPKWHPEETPEQKGRTAKTGEQDKAAGTEKKERKTQHVRGGVWCPVSPELYLFKEKRRKTRNNKKTSSTQTLRQRERDKKQDLTSREKDFKHFRGEVARKYAKTIGKSTPKTQGPKKRAKTKVRSRKFIAQTDPKKKRTLPKSGKGQEPDHKKTQMKKRTAFPPQTKGGEQANNCVTLPALDLANAFV